MPNPLLFELLTEELPPKALVDLSQALQKEILSLLKKNQLLSENAKSSNFETPRRLAIIVEKVLDQAPAKNTTIKLMPSHVGFDSQGKPTQSLVKKMRSLSLNSNYLEKVYRKNLGKIEMLLIDLAIDGARLDTVLQEGLEERLSKLPIPKLMTYQLENGVKNIRFVRPVRGVLAIHGKNKLNLKVLGIESGKSTKGHRFLCKDDLKVNKADDYEDILFNKGKVIASSKKRREKIEKQCHDLANRLGYTLKEAGNSTLLDEVTSLVEWPIVYSAEFSKEFLSLPSECLVLTMTTNQKYFPLYETNGKLTNRFLLVSNMDIPDPSNIIEGNERVISPRLHDARFFYENDIKTSLKDKVIRLKKVIFHHKLGTLFERSERIEKIATHVARQINCSTQDVQAAGKICKADLTTDMVAEFPELQGVMGKYYAILDHEKPIVAQAIEDQYLPRFHGDKVPSTKVSICLALADKIDSLIAMFGINLIPSGDKDPYALRRFGLGVARILVENKVRLNLAELLNISETFFKKNTIGAGTGNQVYNFILDRMRGYFREHNFTIDEIEAVLSKNPASFDNVEEVLKAIKTFKTLRTAADLSSTNKRIKNILRKNYHTKYKVNSINFHHESEVRLNTKADQLEIETDRLIADHDFSGALKLLSEINDDIDYFFDSVLVIDNDEDKKNNRLALLAKVDTLMNKIAKISELDLSRNYH